MRDYLYKEFPELFQEIDPEKNSDIDLKTLTSGSHQILWWVCPDGHSWEAPVNKRSQGYAACPQCDNSKSLAEEYPTLMKQWDFSKNTLDPEKLTKSSTEIVYWRCRDCDHKWQERIDVRTKAEDPRKYPKCPNCGQ